MQSIEQILNQQDPTPLKQILLYLYSCQTHEEQQAEVTVESNGRGFNMIDAEFLSSLAQQVLKGYNLSEKQLVHARLRLPKYKHQLDDRAWEQISVPELLRVHGVTVTPDNTKSMADEIIQRAANIDIAYAAKRMGVNLESAGTLKTRKEGSKIGLVFYPNVYPSKQIKSIGFTRWEDGCWHQSAPSVNPTAVSDVVKLFGETVVVDPEVTALVENTKSIDLPADLKLDGLYPYQVDTIKYQLLHPHSLIALAPRLGKTVTTIFATQAANCKRVLVIAPLSLLLDWKRKIKTWCGEDAAIVYKKQLLVPNRYTITNYDTVRLHPETFKGEAWDCIIVDESLLIKNRRAKRTESIQSLVQDARPKYLWLLSGAPVSRMFTDLWSQLKVIDPDRFTSFWRFAERYCIVEQNQWSNYNLVGDQPDAAERIKSDLADIYFYRAQEDVLDLPPWHIDNIGVAMSPAQDKVYAGMEEEFMAELGEDETLMAPNILAQMTRLVQIASNPVLIGGKNDSNKWRAAIEMLQFEQLPAIVWTSFIETAKEITAILHEKGYTAAMLTGATPPQERQPIVEDFQAGKLQVIVAHPAVGKFGLDLFAAKTVIYLERGYNGDDYYQSLNRVRHVNQTVSPHIIQLLSERAGENGGGTVDHVIDKVLQGRRERVLKLTTKEIKNMFWEKNNA